MAARKRLAVAFFALLAGASPAQAADSIPGLLHPDREESTIVARWRLLGERDDVLRLSEPRLTLALVNPGTEPALIRSRLRVGSGARFRTLHLPVVRLGPGDSRDVVVNLRPALQALPGLRFSGKITLALRVTEPPGHVLSPESAEAGRLDSAPARVGRRPRPGPHGESVDVSVPALYFHPEGEGLVVYREDAMRERFRAGNFRGEPLQAPDPSVAIRDDLAQLGLGRIEPVLAFVHRAAALPRPQFPDDVLPPGSKKFCFGLDGGAFDDSGVDPGFQIGPDTEDFGLVGDFVPAARGWVAVGQLGNPLFTGFLDGEGCTPFVIADSVNEISTAFFPLYLRQPVDVRGFVSDLNLGPQWPDSMPWFLFFFSPGSAQTVEVLLDPEEYVNTIFVAAANAMERARGGRTDVLYEFRLREANDAAGTNTFYAEEGHPLVRIKYSAAAREKFVIAHEYGHALHIADMAPPFTENDLDYSVTAGEAEQHTVTSKEWQLAAAFEGFAHFVSAVVWNEAVPDEDALFASDGDGFALDVFDQSFETNFDADQFPDQGVELDWAQFFWNYHTDQFVADSGEEVLAPPLGAILDMWLASQPWPVNQGFFEDFRAGVQVILGTFGPANPVAEGLQRFDDIAAQAGIDH